MSTEMMALVVTALLAAVAITAAIVAVRAARRAAAASAPDAIRSEPPDEPSSSTALVVAEPAPENGPDSLVPHVVRGRVIVPPTQDQVVATALGRPGVRLSILAHGVAHALRPESRDRILGMMRREYRRRRRHRLQAGRRAARAARPSPASEQWLSS